MLILSLSLGRYYILSSGYGLAAGGVSAQIEYRKHKFTATHQQINWFSSLGNLLHRRRCVLKTFNGNIFIFFYRFCEEIVSKQIQMAYISSQLYTNENCVRCSMMIGKYEIRSECSEISDVFCCCHLCVHHKRRKWMKIFRFMSRLRLNWFNYYRSYTALSVFYIFDICMI